jgi:hypothetical protein
MPHPTRLVSCPSGSGFLGIIEMAGADIVAGIAPALYSTESCVVVSMLPSENETLPVNDIAIRQIARRFQSEMLMFRFANYSSVKSFRVPSSALEDFTPRMKQVALALVAPILGHTESESIVLSALRERDRAAKIERALEPEWLAEETLFGLIHERPIHSILVGGMLARSTRNSNPWRGVSN